MILHNSLNHVIDVYSPIEQSKNKGVLAVNRIVQITNELETLKDQKEDLEKQLESVDDDHRDSAANRALQFDLITALEAKELAISRLEARHKSKTAELNLGDPTSATRLERMKNDDWFRIQLNMRALKDRIVSKIREHKFEVANLDRAVRTQAMGRFKLIGAHISSYHLPYSRSLNTRTC